MNHYEKLIEYILNDETDKAREVFHNIVVNRSRQIYENMMDQDQSQLDELGNEINAEEQIGEEEMFPSDDQTGGLDAELGDAGDSMEIGGDAMGGDMGAEGGEGAIEDRVMDLEDALDELKAEFDELMADEEGESAHSDGIDDPDFGDEEGEEVDDAEDSEEVGDEEGGNPFASDDEEVTEGGSPSPYMSDKQSNAVMKLCRKGYTPDEIADRYPNLNKDEIDNIWGSMDDDEEVTEAEEVVAESKMTEVKSRHPRTAAELMREYVETVAEINKTTEGQGVANAGKVASVNTKSTVAGKNDMGGSNKNIARGGSNPAPDGTSAPSADKPKDLIGKVQNTAGGKKSLSPATKPTATQASGVNDKSIVTK